uniref:Uncharacterized protein n=1 Tax=Anguilla anguilla TaxID=7936 RepID=A0A0E9V647_ANGAN
MGGILCIIHNVSGIVCLVYFVLYVRFADRFVFDAPECLKMLPYVMRTVCVLKDQGTFSTAFVALIPLVSLLRVMQANKM